MNNCFKTFFLAFSAISLTLSTSCCQTYKTDKTYEKTAIELPLSPAGTTEQIVHHKGYTASYNKDWRISNWVAYEFLESEVDGPVKRKNSYCPDPCINEPQAENEDYKRSGWDRGHLAPAGDMKWDNEAMIESCYFTNICPQNHSLNNGTWHDLEKKCRIWAKQYHKIYIATGPIVNNNTYGTIGHNNVIVPDAFFKVIMVADGEKLQGAGFVIENKANGGNLSDHIMPIDKVERITGIDFFYSLPDSQEKKMEQECDSDFWLK